MDPVSGMVWRKPSSGAGKELFVETGGVSQKMRLVESEAGSMGGERYSVWLVNCLGVLPGRLRYPNHVDLDFVS